MDQKNRVLVTSLRKLLRRGANRNIKNALGKMHAADVADIFSEFDEEEQVALYGLLPDQDFCAEVISHLDEDVQIDFVKNIPKSQLASIIPLMDSDDSADLLGRLPDERSKEILESLKKEEKEEVEDLLQYPKDTAGGLMTTEVFKLNEKLTVKKSIEVLQNEAEEAVATFYVYVVDEDQKLVGVLSLKQLLLSKPSDVLEDIMIKETISVKISTDQQEVARVVEHYDFLSVPVIDSNSVLMGAITVDDVIDVIREEARDDLLAMGQTRNPTDSSLKGKLTSRYPWLLLSFAGGAACFVLLWNSLGGPESSHRWFYASVVPMLLMVGTTICNQTASVALQRIREGKLGSGGVLEHVVQEQWVALIFAVVSSVLLFLVGFTLLHFNFRDVIVVIFIISFQVILSSALGTLIPWVLNRLQLDPAVGSISIATILSHIFALSVFLGALNWVN